MAARGKTSSSPTTGESPRTKLARGIYDLPVKVDFMSQEDGATECDSNERTILNYLHLQTDACPVNIKDYVRDCCITTQKPNFFNSGREQLRRGLNEPHPLELRKQAHSCRKV